MRKRIKSVSPMSDCDMLYRSNTMTNTIVNCCQRSIIGPASGSDTWRDSARLELIGD